MPSISPSRRSTLPSVLSRILLFGKSPAFAVTITWIVLSGCLDAFASIPGDTYVCVSGPVLSPPALAASGMPSTSTAAISVTRPRPPLPQSAFERESSLLPVPQSALERLWPPGLPPFLSIAILPLTRRAGPHYRRSTTGHRRADRTGRNVFAGQSRDIPRLGDGPAGSPVRVIKRSEEPGLEKNRSSGLQSASQATPRGTVARMRRLVVGHLFPD